MIEDILHLERVIGSIDTIFLKKKKKIGRTKKLTGYLKKYSFIDILLKILQVNSQSHDS